VKDMCFGYGIWAGLCWICIFASGLDLVSGECFFVRVQVFPYLSFSFVNRLFGTWRISGPSFDFPSLPPFVIG